MTVNYICTTRVLVSVGNPAKTDNWHLSQAQSGFNTSKTPPHQAPSRAHSGTGRPPRCCTPSHDKGRNTPAINHKPGDAGASSIVRLMLFPKIQCVLYCLPAYMYACSTILQLYISDACIPKLRVTASDQDYCMPVLASLVSLSGHHCPTADGRPGRPGSSQALLFTA